MAGASTADGMTYGQALFDDMLERFIRPELKRRVEGGDLSSTDTVVRFQLLLPDGVAPIIRLNDEVGGTVTAISTRAMGAGEEVTVADIGGITAYEPRGEDAGIPHVSAFLHSGGWSLVFQFSQGHSSRFEFLERADQFLATARDALIGGRIAPFFDNAFSACELLAKAELLSGRPTIDLVLNSKSHSAIRSSYSLWAHLGNTDMRYSQLLHRLNDVRDPARYLRGDEDLTEGEAEATLELLGDMREHVQGRVAGSASDHDRFFVYATRELKAGQLVTEGDFSPRPLRLAGDPNRPSAV